MVTPWLMMKVAGKAELHHDADAEAGGRLGKLYTVVARPLLRSKGTSAVFLAVVVVALVRLIGGDLHPRCHGETNCRLITNLKLSVVIDCPKVPRLKPLMLWRNKRRGSRLACPR